MFKVTFRLVVLLLGTTAVVGLAVYPRGVAAACPPNTRFAPPCNYYKCTFDGWVLAPLPLGTSCTTGTGVSGRCDGGRAFSPGTCLPYSTGTVYPSYQILSVIYSPPGRSSSFVDYGTGTSWGTSTATTDSWKNSANLEVKIDSNLLFADGSFTVTMGKTWGGDLTKAVDTQVIVQTDFKVPGGAVDGIDHDYDQVHFLLNPQVDVAVDPLDSTHVLWSPKVKSGENANTMWLYVGQLKGTWGLSSGQAVRLAAARIGSPDFAMMLGQNPMANGQGAVNPGRFTLTPYSFYYPPVPTCADNGNASTLTTKLQTNTTNTTTDVYTESYTVGLTIANSADIKIVSTHLKATDTFTYTNSKAKKTSDGTSASTTLQFGQPYCTYQGNTAGHVYLDTLYRTYMFTLDPI